VRGLSGSLGLQKSSGCAADSREQEQGPEDAREKRLGRTQPLSSASRSWQRRSSEAGKAGGDNRGGVTGVSALQPGFRVEQSCCTLDTYRLWN